MKTLKTISTVMGLAILIGCQTPSQEIEVSVSLDITGSNQYKVRISTLTETHLSKVSQVKLSPIASMSEYQKYVREAEISRFASTIDSLLTDLRNMESGKPTSSLFIPIFRELNRLANSKASIKQLVLYTDLFNNTNTLFSIYSQKVFAKFLKNPEKLTELLLQKAPLPENLSGIKVYVIYNPTLDTDTQFLAVSGWFKQLLESKGVEVFIGANLILD